MALEVCFVQDLRQGIIAMVTMAVRVYVANGGHNVEHIRSILDHASAQASLYGIPWSFVISDVKARLGSGYAELLDAAGGLLEGASRE